MKEGPTIVIRAGAVRDAAGVDLRPGLVGVRDGHIVAVAEGDRLSGHGWYAAKVLDLPDRLLIPGLVNAHAHLDLTDLGPRPLGGSFLDWLGGVMADRPRDADTVTAAVRHGAAMSRQAGVAWIGDVAHSSAAVTARKDTELPGVTYLECVGLGSRQPQRWRETLTTLDALPHELPVSGSEPRGVVLGLSPHAPYSAGRSLYAAAVEFSRERALRLCTHAAESPRELEFVRNGTGPFRDLLVKLGHTDADLADAVTGLHPIDHLEPYLRKARWLLVHCNELEDHHLDLLRKARASVAYCPVASDYFGFPAPASDGTPRRHRYRDLLDAGVNVALGTDSIVCQSPDNPQPLSIFAQMRHLHQRDGTHPQTLLAMATLHGLRALLIDDRLATFAPGAPAVFTCAAFDPDDPADALTQALRRRDNVALVEPV
jgi:cytosine/adenosine deaminase-related metal-dependent hydrolase